MSIVTVATNDLSPYDAHAEVEDGAFVLQSRGGAKSSPNPRNTDYGKALHSILVRLIDHSSADFRIIIDSARVQDIPLDERVLITRADFGGFVLIGSSKLRNAMAAFGQASGTASKGNSTKRIRFEVPGASRNQLELMLSGLPFELPKAGVPFSSVTEPPGSAPMPEALDPDMAAAEGNPKLRAHLVRERSTKLKKQKLANMIREFGHLKCERCPLIPSQTLGPHGDAVIEVHHAATQVHQMAEGHISSVDDLQCLCANCHRIVHRELAAQLK